MQVFQNMCICFYLQMNSREHIRTEHFDEINWLPIDQSSDVKEIIKAILDFFIQKFHKHKKHEMLTADNNKKCA